MERSYPTLIDTVGDIGGVIELITMPLALIYGIYLSKKIHNELVHKGILITGKYNLHEDNFKHLHQF